MPNIKTGYDASTMTLSVNDEEVSRALGVLADKTPATLKVAINTTARQARKLMLTEVKKRYDLNAAGKRLIEDLKQRQKATNHRPAAILAITKNDPGAFRADLGYFRTSPTKPYMGPSVRNAPPFFRAHVLKNRPMINLGGTSKRSKGFLVKFDSQHIGMVQRSINEPTDKPPKATRWKNKNGIVEKLYTMSSPSGSAMHHTVWEMQESNVEEMLRQNTERRIRQQIANAKRKGVI